MFVCYAKSIFTLNLNTRNLCSDLEKKFLEERKLTEKPASVNFIEILCNLVIKHLITVCDCKF